MAKAKTVAELTAHIAELTKAHDVMVKEAKKEKAVAAEKIEALTKEAEDLKAKAEAAKVAAKKQREEKAAESVKDMQAKLDAEPHQWVQVFNIGLDDGVDFAFNYEGIQFVLYSGKPKHLAESVIKHLKTRGFPITTEKQGEAGQPISVHGFHHNFNVVNCEEPPARDERGQAQKVAAVA